MFEVSKLGNVHVALSNIRSFTCLQYSQILLHPPPDLPFPLHSFSSSPPSPLGPEGLIYYLTCVSAARSIPKTSEERVILYRLCYIVLSSPCIPFSGLCTALRLDFSRKILSISTSSPPILLLAGTPSSWKLLIHNPQYLTQPIHLVRSP
jgi:hypothetical protein